MSVESKGRKLYGAFCYPDGMHPKVMEVSHSLKALRRRNAFAPLFQVICTGRYPNARGGGYSTYERVSREPIFV